MEQVARTISTSGWKHITGIGKRMFVVVVYRDMLLTFWHQLIEKLATDKKVCSQVEGPDGGGSPLVT